MKIIFSVFSSCGRIDKYISDILKISRKNVTKLILARKIKVNGSIPVKSYIVKKKDIIEIEFFEYKDFDYSKLKILYEDNNIVAIYKPPFHHSAKLSQNIYSVEDFLQKLNPEYTLLNRLDYITSGVLLAAKNKKFVTYYKKGEKELNIQKEYICFLKGKLYEKREVNFLIDHNKRKKVKVKDIQSDLNKTIIKPLAIYKDFTLTNIRIFKGARHQIRAHCAKIGYPLIGDPLYGINSNGKNFFLICYRYFFKELNLDLNFFYYFKKDTKSHLKKLIILN